MYILVAHGHHREMVRCNMGRSFGIKVGIARGEATLRQFPQTKLLILCTPFISLPSLMAEQQTEYVTKLIHEEVEKMMKSLLDNSVQQLKRASSETANSQLKEIKKLKYAEPHNFKRKANEDQFKFNTKVIDTMAEVSGFLQQKEISKAQEEIKKGEQLLREQQKHILLADKSEYGWATVHEYKKHELADNLDDEKRIFKSEIRAKAQRKQNKSKLSVDRFSKPCGPPDAAIKQPIPVLQSRLFPAQPNMFKRTIRPGNCYSCGKAGHWRNECPGSSQQ